MWSSGGGAVLSLFPIFLWWFTLVAASPEPPSWHPSDPPWTPGRRCLKPQVRREWRALSVEERAEWISAVKVRRGFYRGQPYSQFGITSGSLTFQNFTQCLAKVPHKEYVVPYPNYVNHTVDVPLDKNSSMFDGAYARPLRVPFGTRTMLKSYSDFNFIHIDLNPLVRSSPSTNSGGPRTFTIAPFRFGFDSPDPFHGTLLALASLVRSQVRTCFTRGMWVQGYPTLLGLDQRFVLPLGNSDFPESDSFSRLQMLPTSLLRPYLIQIRCLGLVGGVTLKTTTRSQPEVSLSTLNGHTLSHIASVGTTPRYRVAAA